MSNTEQAEEPQQSDATELSAIDKLASAMTTSVLQSAKASQPEYRRSIKPPKSFSVGQKFKTWLSQFKTYAELTEMPSVQRRGQPINLLDQTAFRAVELLRLPESLSFDEFTEKLIERFDVGKTRGDYKLELRSRNQKSSEEFEDYADILMGLAENAYPDVDYSFQEELARDQFLQGVAVGESTREKLFVSQIESARKAPESCKPKQDSKAKPQCFAISDKKDDETAKELKELKSLILQMNERIQSLERKPSATGDRTSTYLLLLVWRKRSYST